MIYTRIKPAPVLEVVSPIAAKLLTSRRGVLAFHPVLCGECGRRLGDPVARACTAVGCPRLHGEQG